MDATQSAAGVGEREKAQAVAFVLAGEFLAVVGTGTAAGGDQGPVQQDHLPCRWAAARAKGEQELERSTLPSEDRDAWISAHDVTTPLIG
ncbi:hypothetical protein [Nonomuraea dietziae]|uniref:Uncharacterized protein n=1 Tax=Nonomuraea dietziae TaxID=65515 RepID=A0A7W5YFR0_9ACTN|nr:hypothetical protein [Nonomuraea dietziae]MBB3733253.1 hypothetical protein [Nonomuraea dietziae]